jgi:hypothetical protein
MRGLRSTSGYRQSAICEEQPVRPASGERQAATGDPRCQRTAYCKRRLAQTENDELRRPTAHGVTRAKINSSRPQALR